MSGLLFTIKLERLNWGETALSTKTSLLLLASVEVAVLFRYFSEMGGVCRLDFVVTHFLE